MRPGRAGSWQALPPTAIDRADATSFLETIRRQAFFDSTRDIVVARAPGRLDVMGGIADYSGSLVLQMPLALAAFAGAQLQPEPAITIRSLQAEQAGGAADVTLPLADIASSGNAVDYARARELFGGTAAHDRDSRAPRWAAYIAGALVVLGRERGLRIDRGLRILIDSRVPLGKGVSSSAAIEVAAMRAIAALLEIVLTGAELAVLCQMVENRVVGAPCGLMDQMTASLGERDRLLALLCQPAELQQPVAIPGGFDVWGIDSGVRHAVTGSDYTSVRVGAFMGYRMIAHLAGLRAVPVPGETARVEIDDPRWNGYLANVSSETWRTRFRDSIPQTMNGGEFLERFGGTTDRVTLVDPERSYPVRNATAHPIHEHERVLGFRELLEEANGATEIGVRLGELMNASHASYGDCGLGSATTDRLFELVSEAGPRRGLFGARITGGGSGGTVAILGRRHAGDAVHEIARRFHRETGGGGLVIHGSSDGAIASGIIRLIPRA